jgi:hypothetical protein
MWPQTKVRIEEYILNNNCEKSRFEIDSHLLQTGYEPEEIEMVWEELFPSPLEISKKEKFKNFLVELINPDFLFHLTFSHLFLIVLSYAGFNILWIIGWKLISWVQSSANLPLPWDLQLLILATLLLITVLFFRKTTPVKAIFKSLSRATFYKKTLVWLVAGIILATSFTSLSYLPQRFGHALGFALPYTGGLPEDIIDNHWEYRNFGACAGEDGCRGKSDPNCKSKAEISVSITTKQNVLPLKQIGWIPTVMGLPHPIFVDASQIIRSSPKYLVIQESDQCYLYYSRNDGDIP